jgi:hypothetical protein
MAEHKFIFPYARFKTFAFQAKSFSEVYAMYRKSNAAAHLRLLFKIFSTGSTGSTGLRKRQLNLIL